MPLADAKFLAGLGLGQSLLFEPISESHGDHHSRTISDLTIIGQADISVSTGNPSPLRSLADDEWTTPPFELDRRLADLSVDRTKERPNCWQARVGHAPSWPSIWVVPNR